MTLIFQREVLVLMNNKYSAVINEILNELISETVEKERIRKMVEQILEVEESYEFNDERPKIRSFLNILIK